MRCVVGLVVVGALAGASAQVHAQEPPRREYVVDTGVPPAGTGWKLVLGGLGTTAAFYALAQPFSYAWPDAPGAHDLRIPVAGPWMAIANNGCPDDEPDCSTAWVVVRGILTAIDGLGQLGGLGIALEGLFVPTAPAAAAPKPRPEPSPAPPRQLFWTPGPMTVGSHGVGLGVVGAF